MYLFYKRENWCNFIGVGVGIHDLAEVGSDLPVVVGAVVESVQKVWVVGFHRVPSRRFANQHVAFKRP